LIELDDRNPNNSPIVVNIDLMPESDSFFNKLSKVKFFEIMKIFDDITEESALKEKINKSASLSEY
jgi:hypothetical protein